MKIRPYKSRSIRFVELYQHGEWRIKVYSIALGKEVVEPEYIEYAKANLDTWLMQSKNYTLPTYKIATLILHEGKEGIFNLLNWWIDECMLQNHVWLSTYNKPSEFENYSDRGIVACTWELEVINFEREAWIEEIMKKSTQPDVDAYLSAKLNRDM